MPNEGLVESGQFRQRKSWEDYFFDIARLVSSRATCPRRQVGCIVTYNKRILSSGYNGSNSGDGHCIDVGCEIVSGACVRTTHAERNAIDWMKIMFGDFMLYQMGEVEKFVVYCTVQPCPACEHYIKEYLPNSEIRFLETYR